LLNGGGGTSIFPTGEVSWELAEALVDVLLGALVAF